MYVDLLRAEHPAIEQVWLVGPRANDENSQGAVWDLVAFGDEEVLQALREQEKWHRDDVALAIVVDGNRFEPAWGNGRGGTLTDLRWRIEDPQSATYAVPDADERVSAVRVR